MTINIVIAEDHGLVRAGLCALLNSDPDFHVVGEADNGYAALKLVERLNPHVLVADIGMPGPSGIKLAETLRERRSAVRVLIVSMHDDAGLVAEAMTAGAAGYLTKRALEPELIRAVRLVAGGCTYLEPHLRAGQATAAFSRD